jgi:hypothetical protein
MFDRWFGSWTDVVAGFAAAAVLVYLVFEVDRQQRKLRDLFFVLGHDSALMTEHLEELVRRGLIRPQRGATIA